jgi:hypothetical protein
VTAVGYIDVKAGEARVAHDADEEAKRLRRQRLRSTAIALGLGFLVLLFYAATIVRMGGHQPPVGEFGPNTQGGQGTTDSQPKGGAP